MTYCLSKTATGQFLTCNGYRCWYLMTGTQCWNVTMWSGRLQGEGVWTSASVGRLEGFGNTEHRWPWGTGWTPTQNFGDVFYGWPLISQNDDQRQYHLWRIADEISVITIFYQTVFTCVLNASNVGSRTLKTSKELVTNMQPLALN